MKKLISQTVQNQVFPDKTRKNQDKLTNRKRLTVIESDLSFSVYGSTTESARLNKPGRDRQISNSTESTTPFVFDSVLSRVAAFLVVMVTV